MTSFTHMVQTLALHTKKGTKKEVAKLIGCNPNTLSSAVKKDTEEKPYKGTLLQAVTEAYDHFEAKPKKGKDKKTKTPGRRLRDLKKVGDTKWSASLQGEELSIDKTPEGWRAAAGKTIVAEASTFKGVVLALRDKARAAA